MDNNQNNEKFVMDTSYMNNTNTVTEPTMVQPNNVQPTIEEVGVVNNTPVQPVMEPTPVVPEAPVVQPTPVVVEPTPVVQPTPVVPETPVIEPQPTVVPQIDNSDPNAIVNEKLKKVEINYNPPSKLKLILMIVFFVLILAFIIFLPNITTFINKYRAGTIEETEEVITTGRLKCSLNTTTTNLDKDYYLVFKFTDKKLERTEFTITTKGDVTLDEETLNKLAGTCKQLKENVSGMKGVSIQCNYSDGKLEEIQSFDLSVVEQNKLSSAFTEAGGNNPEYKYGQDIDGIERNMNASGYSCKREK